jgi:hypothetical protein
MLKTYTSAAKNLHTLCQIFLIFFLQLSGIAPASAQIDPPAVGMHGDTIADKAKAKFR